MKKFALIAVLALTGFAHAATHQQFRPVHRQTNDSPCGPNCTTRQRCADYCECSECGSICLCSEEPCGDAHCKCSATAKTEIPVLGDWVEIPGTEGDQFAFISGGRQLGAYSVSGDYYRSLLALGWGSKSEPPVRFQAPTRKVSQPMYFEQRRNYSQSYQQPIFSRGSFTSTCVGGSCASGR